MKMICRIRSSFIDNKAPLNLARRAGFDLPYKYPILCRTSWTTRGEFNESARSIILATSEVDWVFNSFSNTTLSVSSKESRLRIFRNNSMASSPHMLVEWTLGSLTVGSACCETASGICVSLQACFWALNCLPSENLVGSSSAWKYGLWEIRRSLATCHLRLVDDNEEAPGAMYSRIRSPSAEMTLMGDCSLCSWKSFWPEGPLWPETLAGFMVVGFPRGLCDYDIG